MRPDLIHHNLAFKALHGLTPSNIAERPPCFVIVEGSGWGSTGAVLLTQNCVPGS